MAVEAAPKMLGNAEDRGDAESGVVSGAGSGRQGRRGRSDNVGGDGRGRRREVAYRRGCGHVTPKCSLVTPIGRAALISL